MSFTKIKNFNCHVRILIIKNPKILYDIWNRQVINEVVFISKIKKRFITFRYVAWLYAN